MNFGLIGEKLGHSYSRIIHEKLSEYDYELYSLEKDELDSFMKGRGFSGLNVTIPYKQAVIPYCDILTPLAERLGAVNTIYFDEKGQMVGANTDYYGFEKAAADAGIDFQGKKVLVLGRGGASKAVLAVSEDGGAEEVVLTGRDCDLSSHRDAEIVVNATPVGMYPNNGKSLIDLNDFPNVTGVIDLVYNPLCTGLIQQAEELSIPCANGLSMLVSQAMKSAELFTGREAFCEKSSEILKELKSDIINIVLIGMPGCGKTTIGKELAKLTGKTFIDTDQEIEKSEFSSIPELFRTFGEKYFRDVESRIAEKTGKKSGCIVATGGGIILRKENMDAFSQNGIIVYIDRNVENLATDGRPLSKDFAALREMRKKRMPLYLKYSDIQMESSGNPADTAENICSAVNRLL